MGERKNEWRTALKGAGGGMLAGLASTLLYYCYEQVTSPNSYNALTLLLLGPVLVILGAIAGLLVAAWYSSN